MRTKIELILICFVLLLGFVLRLYRFDNPIGDWHAFRQADTSAVSKVFVNEGIQPLYPKYFDISNIQSGKDNPQGYRFVEFPIYSVLQATAYSISSVFTLEEWGRLLTIIATSVSTLFIYLIVKRYLNFVSAISSAFFFAVLPFSVYYGRVILPDPSTSMCVLGGIYFFSSWISKKNSDPVNYQFVLAILFTASALLLKPFALFFTLPIIYLALHEYKTKVFKKWQLYVFAVMTLAPLVLWRMWIVQYPEGIPASNWLFNEGNIRFTGAFFNWIFAERLSKLILGYFGIALLVLGLFKQNEKYFGFFLSFLVASLLYITVIARGNVQHDYYQILILPAVCIFLGRGVSLLLRIPVLLGRNVITNTVIAGGIVACIVLFSFVFSWFHVRDYFNVNNRGLVTAGEIADKKLPKDAKVIAANEGDTSFLYYVNRRGWPAYQKSPQELKQMGATHIVVPSPTEKDINGLGREFKIYYQSPDVLILSL